MIGFTKEEGISQFNRKWKEGMRYLRENNLIEDNAEAIAGFLKGHKAELDFEQLGEFLCEPAQKEVLEAYIAAMDFAGVDFSTALRRIMTDFKFPGEAQKIDRVMEAFGKAYFKANQNNGDFEFKHEDAVYTLAFSCVMLNTDAHNTSIKKKMTFEEFKRNNRGINQDTNFSDKMLKAIYDDITGHEIKLNTTQTAAIESNYEAWAKGKGGYRVGYLAWYYLFDKTPKATTSSLDEKEFVDVQPDTSPLPPVAEKEKKSSYDNWAEGNGGYKPGYLTYWMLHGKSNSATTSQNGQATQEKTEKKKWGLF
ncbi:MAG: hypothetical protein BGO43_15000 [Gammaproteobacteria bacterium 39-13]|nr:hypothetical protein [Gammaproteobacteria bacterium]OJV86246.1 MAG: hypothetical protein BGO43_15000 [Gammaproteobacteria bacterium 39-13]